MAPESNHTRAVDGKFHPPLFFGLMVGALLLTRAFARPAPARKPARFAGLGLILLGLTTGGSAVANMFHIGTTPDPHQPVTALVETGPYRFTRNPIYLSMILLYSGIAFLANAIWGIFLVPIMLIVYTRGIILREESYLEQHFGEAYLSYKRRVPRWIIK